MEINRIEVISAVVSEMIATLPEERRQKAYIHLFGTAQTAGLIALRRGVNAELAQISGLLHDYRKYLTGVDEKHAEESADADTGKDGAFQRVRDRQYHKSDSEPQRQGKCRASA